MGLPRKSRREKEILAHAAELFDAGEYEQVVNYYEGLSSAVVTPAIVADLARAYANLAVQMSQETDEFDPRPKRMLDYAATLMETADKFSDELGDDAAYFIGKSLLLLDLPNMARPYLLRLQKAQPENEEAAQMLAYCDATLAAPLGIVPFTRRAQASWERFEQREEHIRRCLIVGDDEGAYTLADESLPDSAEFELVIDNIRGTFQLVLSPTHYRVELYKLAVFRDLAPAAVPRSWEVVLGWPPNDDVDFETPRRILYASDVRVWPEFHDEEGCVTLSAWSKGLAKELAVDPEMADRAFMQLADGTVGEVVMMQVLDGVNLLPTPPDEGGLTLQELRGLIYERLGEAHNDELGSFEACLDLEYYFTRVPSESEESEVGDRSDIFACMSYAPELVDEYADGLTDSVDIALSEGIVAGYLFWPHIDLPGVEMNEELAMELCEEVIDALCKGTTEQQVTFIGESYGTRCTYVDVLAWDFPAFVETARQVFDTIPAIEAAAFRTLRPGTSSLALKGSYS